MSNRTTPNLVKGLLVLSLLLFTMFAFAGTSTAQTPTGTPPSGTPGSPTKPASVPKPKPPVNAKSVTGTADWDKAVADVSKSIGFTNYVYEAWQLPATATWDDTYKYYSDQMTQAGWTGQGTIKDITGGKVGAWVSDDGKTGLVMVFIASPDGTQAAYDLAIFGLTTPVPAAKSDWKPSTKTADTDQFAAQFAQMAGFGDYVYEMFDLPATAVWDDVFKYYNDQMAQAGWNGTGASKDFSGGKLGLYVDPNTKTGLWLIFVASPDGTKSAGVVAIFGLSPAKTAVKPAPPANATAVPNNPDLDKSVATIAAALKLNNPTYDAWSLPPTSTSNDIFKYYSDSLSQAGWTDKGTTGQDPILGKYIAFQNNDKTLGLIVLFIASADGTKPAVALAILGSAPAATATPAATPSATTAQPTAAPTTAPTTAATGPELSPAATDKYPLPKGKAGWVVKSFIGNDLNYNINNMLYKIPANGEVFIILDPGTYNYSVNIPGKGEATGTVELKADALDGQTWQQ